MVLMASAAVATVVVVVKDAQGVTMVVETRMGGVKHIYSEGSWCQGRKNNGDKTS